jgi:ribosomal protein S18 acetylase RimI-like enzyme
MAKNPDRVYHEGMDLTYRRMTIGDFGQVLRLWESDPGIGLSEADSEENVRRFLELNGETNLVALQGERIVGSVLCGNDGRRGYLYHLVVAQDARKRGIGGRLIELCLEALKEKGIDKCHLFVFETNELAIEFYRNADWTERDDLKIFSKKTR